MKNIFKNLMLVAVAAMGFTSCQENINDDVTIINPNEVEMTINADMDETRTFIDETNGRVLWSEGDQLKVIENNATYRTTTEIEIVDGKAKFTVAFPANTSAAEFTYNAIFPASAVVEDDAEKIDGAKIKVIVKDQQMATATSFDPLADVLVSREIVSDAQPTELNMQFKRLVALGKMTLTGLPENAEITNVVFTAGANDVLAGRNYVNATTGEVSEYGYFGKTNAITVNYDEAIATRDIYFTCNPFAMEAGETFKVKVVCADKIYTREVEIPAGRSLTFTEGNLGIFTVDMTSATVESNVAFAAGNYAVIAKNGSKYYAMKGVKGSGNFMTYAEVSYDGASTTFATDDETLVWTIAEVDGGYTIQNYEGKYLYGSSSGNYAYLGNAQTLTLTPVDDTANQYKIAVKEISERILGFNTNSGQERFAFYKGTQENKLYLVPVVEDTTPRFEVGPETLVFDSEATAIDDDFFTVTAVNGFDITKVTATTDAEWLYIEDSEASDGVYYMCPAANEGEKRSADVVFSAEGLSVTVTVEQQAAEGAVEDTNITIAKFLERKDTATEYTLTGKITSVANTTYGNFDLTDETGTVYVYGLLTPDGTPQKQWAAAGLKVGDTITIKGKYNVYNDKPQVKNAVYVSHVSAPFISAANVSVSAEITTATIDVESNVAWSVSCSETWVTSYTKSGENNGTIEIEMEANELTENREAVFTLTAEGVTPVTVKLTQIGLSTGGAKTVIYDFTAISGFSSWSSSYAKHTVEYDDATVVFASADRQTGTITNMPVTKGNDVEIKAKNGATMSSVEFICKQWGTKPQTITLHYSTDGGSSYSSTGVTSTNFTIASDSLPDGTNAVKITFSSKSNQVGIQQATVAYLQ